MHELHMYETIYQQLREDITAGKYTIGSKLPTERELCAAFDVSRITAKRSLDMLAADGLVERVKGKGTILIDTTCTDAPSDQEVSFQGKHIGVIMPDFTEFFGLRLLYGIEEECAASNCFFTLRRSNGNLEAERQAIHDLRALGVDGLAIVPLNGEYYNTDILQLILSDYPIVIMDRQMKGLNTCFVGTDNITCTKEMTRYLFALGHRNIAWISPPAAQTSTLEDRADAFREVFIENNLMPNRDLWLQSLRSTLPLENTPETLERDTNLLTAHFKRHPEITAVFASEYLLALLANQVALAMGMGIPEDLSIVCFDAPQVLYRNDEFTHIQQNEQEIGRQAIRQLLRQLTSPPSAEQKEVIIYPGKLISGRSTGIAKA